MSNIPDDHVPCPECDGQGGSYGFDGGYTVHGSGYGDATPTESATTCTLCDGHATVPVGDVPDDLWSEVPSDADS
jgi:hypothetical protein